MAIPRREEKRVWPGQMEEKEDPLMHARDGLGQV